ncbi:hypothetical protein PILCRDRAFT_821209 [Piloderma croceum F 1598]|uniref:Uncharacterized protein n=1 Tax=Piloderma croceum (strain F 1598) TaxID=765440 RepID=A0A0C3FB06_PILCF|nr:hypothetical protein PILCRDRAFT_821209 [Piloderma croceum F 1598]
MIAVMMMPRYLQNGSRGTAQIFLAGLNATARVMSSWCRRPSPFIGNKLTHVPS